MVLKVFLVIGKMPDMTRHLKWISSLEGWKAQEQDGLPFG